MQAKENRSLKYVYKYRTVNAHTINLLEKCDLYFSHPKEFNDPFDSKTDVIFEGTEIEWKKWLDESKRSPEEKEIIWNLLKRRGFEKFENGLMYEDRAFLISSFSKIDDDILLWSHYANSHKGVCLGFKISEVENTFGLYFEDEEIFQKPHAPKNYQMLHNIIYSIDDKMPQQINRLKDDKRELYNFLVTKQKNWSYEQEMRIILPTYSTSGRTFKFAKHCLSKIIFGMNISTKDIATIKQVIDEVYIMKGFNVALFQAKPIKGKYAVEIQPIQV
jgi:hypothetical protein